MQTDRKGDPELPLTDDDLNDKLRELAAPAIGIDAVESLLTRLWSLDRAPAIDLA
jgi:hypothetical protein